MTTGSRPPSRSLAVAPIDDVAGGVATGPVPPDGFGEGAAALQSPGGRVAPAVHDVLPGKGTWTRPAGTWLVVNASGPELPGKVNPPFLESWKVRAFVRAVLPLFVQAGPEGFSAAATRPWITTASESGSLAGGPNASL